MTTNATLSVGSGGIDRYTVIRRGGCVLIEGAIPASDFDVLAKLAPPRAIMAPDLARLAGVNFAFGLRLDVDALIAELKPQAEATARRQYPQLSREAAEWLASGERGVSSETIFSHLTGIDALKGYRKDVPYDPADFRRCQLLLEQVPELQPIFHRMARVSDAWDRLVKAWPDIIAAMDEEAPGWRDGRTGQRAHKAYALIKEAIGRA